MKNWTAALADLQPLLQDQCTARLFDQAGDCVFGAGTNRRHETCKEVGTTPVTFETQDAGGVFTGALIALTTDDLVLEIEGPPTAAHAVAPLARVLLDQWAPPEERRVKRHMQAILDHAPSAVLVKDLNGKYIVSNRGHDAIWGAEPGSMIGRSDAELFSADELADYQRTDDEVIAEKKSMSFEGTATRDGQISYFRVQKFPMLDAKGNVFAIGVIGTDITDFKEQEGALRASEAKLHAILDHAPSAILIKGLDGRYELSNKAHDALWEIPPGSLIGKSDSDFYGERLAAEFKSSDVEILATHKTMTFEDQHTINGKDVTFLVNKFPLVDEDHQCFGIGLVATEITEQKMREAKLQASEERLQAIVDNMPAYVLVKNTSDVYTLSNKAHDRLWGCEPGKLVGQSLEAVHGVEIASQFKAEDEELHATGSPVGFEKNHDLDGSKRTVLGHKFPLFDADGNIDSIGIVATDVSELKAREQALHETNEKVAASIRYAARIQSAMLPSPDLLSRAISDHFLVWQPRDVVGGDLYWLHQREEGTYLIVGDCTGHGAPGAFMTLISCGVIDRRLRAQQAPTPATLLAQVNADLKVMLDQQEKSGLASTDDGLEAGVCFMPADGGPMTYAGARFSLFAVEEDADVCEYRGDKMGLAFRHTAMTATFTDHQINIADNASFYMLTDGVTDQIGGHKRLAFGKRRVRDLLKDMQGYPLTAQRELVQERLSTYQGAEHRRDDVTFLGFRPPKR